MLDILYMNLQHTYPYMSEYIWMVVHIPSNDKLRQFTSFIHGGLKIATVDSTLCFKMKERLVSN